MRTNIELDDGLLDEAARYSSAHSKRGIVHEALATYVAVKAEERQRQTYRDRLEELRRKTAGLRIRSDVNELIRKDRDSR